MNCNKELSDFFIYVDIFYLNKKSHHFFLTHAHTDHMRHLSLKFLQNNPNFYCSQITLDLISLKFKSFKPGLNLKILKENYWNKITEDIDCYSISANHYPGSLFLIFKIKENYYVHTGDFRLDENLKNSLIHLEIPKVEKLFLDTTFKDIEEIPTLEDSFLLIEEYFLQNKHKHIFLYYRSLPALLLQKLFSKIGAKVYCPEKYKTLRYFFKIYLTDDKKQANVVITDSKNDIIMSCLSFHCVSKKNIDKKKIHENRFYVSYHPSKNELDFIVKIFKANKVYQCSPNNSYINTC
jgi:hypothetical protein